MTKTTQKTSKTFVDMYESFKHKDSITLAEFRLILKTFNYLLMNDVVTNGTVYSLPSGLGILGAFKRATVGRGMFQYQHYKETGEKVYKKNLHSGGYAVNIKHTTTFPYAFSPIRERGRMIVFRATREFKRYLASLLKTTQSVDTYYDLP